MTRYCRTTHSGARLRPPLTGNADAPRSSSASFSPEQKMLTLSLPVGGGNFSPAAHSRQHSAPA